MKDIQSLHAEAMDLAEAAALSRAKDEAEAARLLRRAFELEREAASLCSADFHLEPTRSALHRGAASLAIDCGEYREAERLIATALSGEPPEEIKEELRDLLEHVYFHGDLALRGSSLGHIAAARVVRAEIHPAIGVARVGNSPSGYFIGPEVTDPAPEKPGFFRDETGALKREAARFRVYGYNADGEVIGELTADTADIRWTVHVANSKAAWYQWTMALDIPEAAGSQIPRRNKSVTGAGRKGLVIDGGPKSISGKGMQGAPYEFRGQFQGVDVYLGEVRTDDSGRLLFLGGHGVSASPTGSTIFNPDDPNGFINADGWYDDMSDGPVTAEVTIAGRSIPVEAAWVLTAPPNYGPNVHGIRTLYDLLVDLYIQAGWLDAPAEVSFQDDVYPLLRRLSNLQWVNFGFATQFGTNGPNDFEDPDYRDKLARVPRPGEVDLYGELRRQVFLSFRSPDGTDNNQMPWPWIYGDAMDVPPANTPRQNASISPTQYLALMAWAAGKFVAYRDKPGSPPDSFSKVPLQDQPAMLDRAALTFCLADAFHPGCEVTWPMRHLSMFRGPFRNPPPPARRVGTGLRQDVHAGHSPVADRAAPRARARRSHPLDGTALAGGYGLLPIWLRHELRPVRADVLASPGAQSDTHRTELSDRGQPGRAARAPARGVHRPDGMDRPAEGLDGRADGADGADLRRHGARGGARRSAWGP